MQKADQTMNTDYSTLLLRKKVVGIGLERLRPFENHPFKVKEDEAMARLMESIERYAYYKRVSIDRKQLIHAEKYKDRILKIREI